MKGSNKLFAFLVLFFLTSSVSAGVIQLDTKLDVKVNEDDGSSEVSIHIQNNGDETAYDVGLDLILPEGFSSEGLSLGNIDAGDVVDKKASISNPEGVDGEYPLFLRTQYSDANNYMFSSLKSKTFNIGRNRVSRVSITTDEVKMVVGGDATMRAVLFNSDTQDIDAKVKLHLPDEITSSQYVMDKTLKASQRQDISFDLSYFKGITGSTYFGFVSAEYDRDGLHYTKVTPVKISLVEPVNFSRYALVFAIIALAAVILYMKSKSKTKRKRKK